jgi:hypothetical protein
MGFESIGNAPVEPLHYPVGARRSRLGQSAFDFERTAQWVKRMVARGLALSGRKQAVAEFLAVVREQLTIFIWQAVVQGLQIRLGTGGRVVARDLNKHPARGPFDGHEQVAPLALIGLCGRFSTSMCRSPGWSLLPLLPLLPLLWAARGIWGSRALRLPRRGGADSGPGPSARRPRTSHSRVTASGSSKRSSKVRHSQRCQQGQARRVAQLRARGDDTHRVRRRADASM